MSYDAIALLPSILFMLGHSGWGLWVASPAVGEFGRDR